MNNSRNFQDGGSRGWGRNKDNKNRYKKDFSSGQELGASEWTEKKQWGEQRQYNDSRNNDNRNNYNNQRNQFRGKPNDFANRGEKSYAPVKEQQKPVNVFNVREEYGKLMSSEFKWVDYCVCDN